MRSWQICLLVLCELLLAADASAAGDDASGGAERLVLVAPGADYEYLASSVPEPAGRFVAIALHDLDASKGSAKDSERPKALQSGALPPTDWERLGLGKSAQGKGAAPLASRSGKEPCRCKTVVADTSKSRVAALYLSHSFVLPEGTELSKFQMLELKVGYRDGLHAYLNGVPIASRNLGANSSSATESKSLPARRPRGPELERFLAPLRPGLLRKGKNVLSFEVRPSANRQGVRLDASLTLRKAGRVVRGPLLQQVGEGSALLLFDTDVATKAHISYGATKDLGSRVASVGGGLARHHRFRLINLKAGQVVYYRVETSTGVQETRRFHMPPGDKEPLRFAVYGDMRGGHGVHGKIVKSLLEEAIDLWWSLVT